jgi:bacillithiol biosynthesis cysteine-adding enzyme BshC
VAHAEISAVVSAQLQARGAPAAALASAVKLANPDTVAIVAGQQAGLFGGPLFTLLKALTTVRLARRVSSEHNVTAVPVFWVHGEDHDLDEISSCGTLTSDLELRTVTVPHESTSDQPASEIQLPDSIADVISDLRELLPETEFTDDLFEQLASIYRPGVGMVEAFSRWMDALLGPHGLIVFDASDANAKPMVRTLLDRELEIPGQTSRLAATAGERLSALGYHAQVTLEPDAVALFYLGDGRQAIRLQTTDSKAGPMFDIGTDVLPSDRLRTQLSERPEAFSPNVLLRPVIQDAMFPTVATVAGPSELAYLAQLRDVYHHFDVPMPIIYPRASATLVDQATLKFLHRYTMDFEMLQPQDDGVLNRLLAALLPDAVERTLGATEQTVSEHLAAVAAEVSVVDPTLIGVVETTQSRIDRDLKHLRNKIVQAAKRIDETLRRQYYRARAQAFPNGDPQERAIGVIYFLNRYGPHLIELLMNELTLEVGQHDLLTL